MSGNCDKVQTKAKTTGDFDATTGIQQAYYVKDGTAGSLFDSIYKDKG